MLFLFFFFFNIFGFKFFCGDFKLISCLEFLFGFHVLPWKSICGWGYFSLSVCSVIGHVFFPLCVEDYVVFVLLLSLLPFLFFPAMKALPFFPFWLFNFQHFHVGLVDSCCFFPPPLCSALYFAGLCVTPLAIWHTFLVLLLWITFPSECLRWAPFFSFSVLNSPKHQLYLKISDEKDN